MVDEIKNYRVFCPRFMLFPDKMNDSQNSVSASILEKILTFKTILDYEKRRNYQIPENLRTFLFVCFIDKSIVGNSFKTDPMDTRSIRH